jgi:hypothetical protein
MMTLHYTNHRGIFLNLDSKDQIQTTADFSSILIRRTKLIQFYLLPPFARAHSRLLISLTNPSASSSSRKSLDRESQSNNVSSSRQHDPHLRRDSPISHLAPQHVLMTRRRRSGGFMLVRLVIVLLFPRWRGYR